MFILTHTSQLFFQFNQWVDRAQILYPAQRLYQGIKYIVNILMQASQQLEHSVKGIRIAKKE